jgi:putative hemolysin
VSLAEPLEDPLDVLGGAARPASILLVTLILSYLTLVAGELAPKRLAMQRAERWGLLVARPLAAMSSIARPAVWFLSRSSDVVVRVLGGDPDREREEVTEEELRELVAMQASFSPQQRRIIDGAFEIAERSLHEVMRPRPDVFTLASSMRCRDARDRLAASGHSRAPVCRDGSLDEVVGVVHLRDLLDSDRTVGDVANSIPVMPETARVLEALRDMQVGHDQMVVVVNEHGGAEGIVTVEDLVEELVGEIRDEHDNRAATEEDPQSLVVDGHRSITEIDEEHGLEIRSDESGTVAEFVAGRFGRVPRPGESIRCGRSTIEVIDSTPQRVRRIRLRRDR